VEWLKVKALSSNPVPQKEERERERERESLIALQLFDISIKISAKGNKLVNQNFRDFG
jgi:hypothetical protein